MAYLFVHFIGESENGEQIYFSVSKDALHFTDIGEGPVLRSAIGEKGVRDPFIVRNCIDHKFYILATDLRIANNKGWEVAQYSGSVALIVWESEDLIHWHDAKRIEFPEMKSIGAGCMWAPETIYDKEKNAYLVYWASMIEGKQRIFAAWTKDFTNFEDIRPYIEKKHHIIDTTIAEENGEYYRFSACADYEGIALERGLALTGSDFRVCRANGIDGTKGTEGPIITYIREMKKWCLYVDDIRHGAGYVPFLSDTLANDDFARVPAENYDFGLRRKRHGSVLEISDEEYERMLSYYGIAR